MDQTRYDNASVNYTGNEQLELEEDSDMMF